MCYLINKGTFLNKKLQVLTKSVLKMQNGAFQLIKQQTLWRFFFSANKKSLNLQSN